MIGEANRRSRRIHRVRLRDVTDHVTSGIAAVVTSRGWCAGRERAVGFVERRRSRSCWSPHVRCSGTGLVVWAGAAMAARFAGERPARRCGGRGSSCAPAAAAPVRSSDGVGRPGGQRGCLAAPSTGAARRGCHRGRGVAWSVLRLWRAQRDRGRVRLGVETRARFATTRDLAPLVVQRPVPSGRFVLGRVHGQLVATEDRRAAEADGHASAARGFRQGDRGSVAVIGPSRSGKTVNVIAGLLDWDGPAVVVSVKRDLIDATRAARSANGETRVFDPSGVSGLPTAGLARWTPLRAASTPTWCAEGGHVAGGVDPTVGSRRGRRLLGEAGRDPPHRTARRRRARPEPDDGRRRRVGVHQVDPGQGRAERDRRPAEDAKDYGTRPSARRRVRRCCSSTPSGTSTSASGRRCTRRCRPSSRRGSTRPSKRPPSLDKHQPAFVDLDWLVEPGPGEHAVPRRPARRPEAARPGARRPARRPQGSGVPSATSPASASAGRC